MKKKAKFLGTWKKRKPRRQNAANALVPVEVPGGSRKIALDLAYYRERYSDLRELDDRALEQHWHSHGFREGRFASASHEAGDAVLVGEVVASDRPAPEAEASARTVDLEFYLALYPDLKPNGVSTQAQADAHYEQHGKAEGRVPSLAEWAQRHGLPLSALPDTFSLADVLRRSAERGVELEPQAVLDTLLGQQVAPIALDETPEKTLAAFLKLGKHYLSSQQRPKGRAMLEAGLSFAPSAEALELLGNSYLDEGHPGIALGYYNAASEFPNPPKWTAYNRASCLVRLNRLDEAMQVLAGGIAANPNFRQQHDELDRLAEQRWNGFQAELLVWVDAKDREQLVQQARRFAHRLYQAYLPLFGGPGPGEAREGGAGEDGSEEPMAALPPLGSINTDRVLIVGDYHVPQCERYRINQKIEQLEAVGKKVTAVNWMELEKHGNALALHDIVIFYRVPAVPKVIKAIAQVNATGKLSLYEIDDLIFVPEYPPAIESYGGYVGLETYRGLTRGMALFNAAASLCRIGIASTEPLREHLAPLVREGRCLLHRNGLDHLNQFRTTDKSQKKTIDIFYGSGTQAHNSDFIEQALPAIERILAEMPQVRLVVVGYLRLPKEFRTRFVEQYRQLPPVKSVQAYWSLLEQADINIAVLQDDRLNDCKSELKWFEAACFGIPSVVSSTANYRDVVKDGEDAFLAATPDEWYGALKRLTKSVELRQKVGQAALQRAKEDYSLEALGGHLSEQLEEVAAQAQPRRRKLALVNVFFPPQAIGGATRVVADNFSALRKHYAEELDVCVFTADAEYRTPHEMTVYRYKDCRVYRATTLWREHMDWHPKDPEMHRLFTHFLELEQPDLIHFHCVQRLTASIVEAARDAGIPYIVTVHDAWWISDFQFLVDHKGKVYPEGHPDPFAPVDLPPGIKLEASIERRQYLKSLLLDARQALTVSKTFAGIYQKNGVNELDVIPNGISDEIPWGPKDTSYTEKVVCGHVGGMSEHKGYYLLKEAVLAAQPKHLAFLVVDHSKEEGYEAYSNWGEVPVKFVGRVDQRAVVDLYKQIDVLMAPSTWPESFGLVTREASACGCWVIASKCGGIGEGIQEGHNGYLIHPDLANLRKVLTKIDSSPSHFKKLCKEVRVNSSIDQVNSLVQLYADKSTNE